MRDDDWQPPPGMVKRNCNQCRRPFASKGDRTCPSCKVQHSLSRRRMTETPIDVAAGAAIKSLVKPNGRREG